MEIADIDLGQNLPHRDRLSGPDVDRRGDARDLGGDVGGLRGLDGTGEIKRRCEIAPLDRMDFAGMELHDARLGADRLGLRHRRFGIGRLRYVPYPGQDGARADRDDGEERQEHPAPPIFSRSRKIIVLCLVGHCRSLSR